MNSYRAQTTKVVGVWSQLVKVQWNLSGVREVIDMKKLFLTVGIESWGRIARSDARLRPSTSSGFLISIISTTASLEAWTDAG
jgi:hypothetical protein